MGAEDRDGSEGREGRDPTMEGAGQGGGPAAEARPAGTGPQAPPPGEPPPGEPPRLRRSKQDRVLFGVAGGLGHYLGVDPVIVRIGFVLLALFGGSGVLLYLIGLIAIPEEKPGEPIVPARSRSNITVAIGVLLVLVGGWALLREIVPGIGDLAGPLLLILLGAVVLLAARR